MSEETLKPLIVKIDSDGLQCLICRKVHNSGKSLASLAGLKPRFVRLLQQQHPNLEFGPFSVVCKEHIAVVLQSRVDELVMEDQNQFSKLQEDAMKNLEKYEIEEKTWKDQFDIGKTFGERAADVVAHFGGSWGFLISLLGFLALWMGINLVLSAVTESGGWDPYPFILLNLILSMIAASQAPVIMMSQNRQSAIDRKQNDFVAHAILRNEHQTRHVDAKLDHLLTYQWKRLLEIQEIQTQLLETHLEKKKKKMQSPFIREEDELVWSSETIPDPLTVLLLKHIFEKRPESQFIFSHWHQDGDNYTGDIRDVSVEIADSELVSIDFWIDFTTKSTLDDMFSGEGHVHLRNDFNLDYMQPRGQFRGFELPLPAPYSTIENGDFPPRYKPVFSRVRQDRITDLWKTHFHTIRCFYAPTRQVCSVTVPPGKQMRMTITLHQETRKQHHWKIYRTQGLLSEKQLGEAMIKRPCEWDLYLEHEEEEPKKLERRNSTRSVSSLNLDIGQLITLSGETLDEGTWWFLCDDGRVGYHGVFE
ncbi:hypothetical protein EDD86DRAFT_273266 [Gorgonomyces haynaldii]|nr:hypothetical protein EDD86DRAFT_273266 [Gorgonomyces haynaldii]